MQQAVEQGIGAFVEATKTAFGNDVTSIVLFGSAAEDRLRPTSDLNVVVVLRAFDPAKAEALREALAIYRAALRLYAMFILEREIPSAARAFAVKFTDIARRHKVLYGSDPFTALDIPRSAAIDQLRQALLNSILRLRERYISSGQNEEQLTRLVADFAGPLRSSAAELLTLENQPAPSAREALQKIAGDPLAELSSAREQGTLPVGAAGPLLLKLLALCEKMRERAGALK